MSDPSQNRRIAPLIAVPLACYLGSSLLVLLAVWFGVTRLPRGDGEPPGRRSVLDGMLAWDGGWYKAIAQRGYYYQPRQMSNVVFFPLYPLASLDVAMLTGLSIEAAMVLVSHLCFAAALVVLAAYCRERWPEAPRVWPLTLLCCALFPAGCFFRMGYSESCFLLLSVVTFYGLQRPWPAAVTAAIIGLATATRPTGVALLAPLALHTWRARSSTRQGILALAAWLPVGCWGLGAYMAYQYFTFGNPLAFADAQESWHIRPLVPAGQKAVALATLEPLRAVYDSASPAHWCRFDRHWWLSWQITNPIVFVAAWLLVASGWRRRWLTDGEASFAGLLLLIPYLTRGYEMGMGSMPRFVSVAFPTYIVVSRLLEPAPRWLAFIILAAMASYLAIFSARFAAGYFVF